MGTLGRRRRTWTLVTTLVLSGGIASSVFPWEREAKGTAGAPFLWKVTGPSGYVYLFGSIHLGTRDIYPLPAEVESAFSTSKHLVVEADIDKADAARVQAFVAEKGMYPKDDSLGRHLKKTTFERLKTYLGTLGIPVSAFEQQKPWLVSVALATLAAQRQGMDPGLGLDKHFLDEARAAGKEVLELESVEYQLDLLASFSDEEQDANLLSTLTDIDTIPALLAAWKSGDAARLESIFFDPANDTPELKVFMVRFLDERNSKMVERIDGYLEGPAAAHFVVVGVGHLLGEKGLVRLLQDRKYKVERIARGAAVPAGKKSR